MSLTRNRTHSPLSLRELRLLGSKLPRGNFFHTPFVPEGRGILQARSKTHPRTAKNTHVYIVLALTP